MKAKVHVTLKNGVLDSQGSAIEKTLHHIGFEGVNNVRQGKFIELEVAANDTETAEKQVKEMCEKLLANSVIENYEIQIVA